jgi:hypothetical protein
VPAFSSQRINPLHLDGSIPRPPVRSALQRLACAEAAAHAFLQRRAEGCRPFRKFRIWPRERRQRPRSASLRDRFAVAERVQRLGEQLMPILDRTTRMMIRNLKAIKKLRQGHVPAIAIGRLEVSAPGRGAQPPRQTRLPRRPRQRRQSNAGSTRAKASAIGTSPSGTAAPGARPRRAAAARGQPASHRRAPRRGIESQERFLSLVRAATTESSPSTARPGGAAGHGRSPASPGRRAGGRWRTAGHRVRRRAGRWSRRRRTKLRRSTHP